MLADTLRTDRARLRPLTRDSEQTLTLRMTVRARQDLVRARVALGNQLRAHLQTTLPGAVGLFRDIDSDITLAFLRRFPSQDKADWLSPARLERWLRGVGYNHLANLDPALGSPARCGPRHHRSPGLGPSADHLGPRPCRPIQRWRARRHRPPSVRDHRRGRCVPPPTLWTQQRPGGFWGPVPATCTTD